MTIQHLGPMKSSSSSGESSKASSTTSSNSSDTSNISQDFSKQMSQLGKMRADFGSVQNNIDQSSRDIPRLEKVLAEQSSNVKSSQGDVQNAYKEHFDANISAFNLRSEAKLLRKLAEGKPRSIALVLIEEAKNKEKKAKEEEKRAEECLMKADNAKRETSKHNQSKNNTEDTIGSVINNQSSLNSEANNSSKQSNNSQMRALTAPASVDNESVSGGNDTLGGSSVGFSAVITSVNDGSSSGGSSNVSGGSANGSSGGSDFYGGYGDMGSTSDGSSGFVIAAEALLRQISNVTRANLGFGTTNPVRELSMNLTNKGLSEQAITYLEAALVDTAIQGTPTNQQIILRKAQASTLHGESETNVAYWKEVLNENKQLEKQTHDLSKMA